MLVHWIWLATRQGLSERIKYELVHRYGDPEAVYQEPEPRLPGISPAAAAALKDKALEQPRRILQECRQKGIGLLTLQDAAYPRRLKGIYDPPILLYYLGTLPDWEERPIIGAVGTRSCSDYGIRAGRKLGHQLLSCGGGIASGMAEGIDEAVLTGALDAGGTVAVFLAGGVDVVYPRQNRWLYDRILEKGCILSEYPPGTGHMRWHFPVRNRLISGVSNGVLVVEAPEKSGALITARHAMEQGRDVFAVPGTIDSDSGQGSNQLIKDGAMIARSGWEILELYESVYPGVLHCNGERPPVEKAEKSLSRRIKEKKVIDNGENPPYSDVEKKPVEGTGQEQAILKQLLQGAKPADKVILDSGLPYGEALAAMTMLEIGGKLKRLPGNLLALNET